MAANAGWSVASIDSEPHGGTCALRGCDPKKMLIAVTEGVEWAENMKGKGLEAQPSVNWSDMIAFKRSFTDVFGGYDKLKQGRAHTVSQAVRRD